GSSELAIDEALRHRGDVVGPDRLPVRPQRLARAAEPGVDAAPLTLAEQAQAGEGAREPFARPAAPDPGERPCRLEPGFRDERHTGEGLSHSGKPRGDDARWDAIELQRRGSGRSRARVWGMASLPEMRNRSMRGIVGGAGPVRC